MKNENDSTSALDRDEPRPEYDFSNAMPNKYAKRYKQGTNVVLLDPEVAEVFRDSNSVNEALKPIARMIRQRSGLAA